MRESFTVETAKVVGTPSAGFWSQTHFFSPPDLEKKEKRGSLLAIFVLKRETGGLEALSAGREVLVRLNEEYYGDISGSAFEKLGGAVEKVCHEQEGLEIVAAVYINNILYLAVFGKGKTVLKREGKIGVVLSGEGGLKTGSGVLRENDLLLLGSEKFFEVIKAGALRAALESEKPADIAENLAPVVMGRSDAAGAGAIFGRFSKETEENISKFDSEQKPKITKSDNQFVEDGLLKTKKENIFKKIFKNRFFGQRETVFIKEENLRKKKKLHFLLAVLLLLGLGSAMVFGVKNRSVARKEKQAAELLRLAEDKFNQGKALFSSQPEEAKNIINEAKKDIEDALALKKDFEEGSLMKEQIERFLAASETEVKLASLPVFMDLTLIEDGAKANSFVLLNKDFILLDSDKKTLYLLNSEKKSFSKLNFLSEGAEFLTAFDSKSMIFSPKGIEEINLLKKTQKMVVDKDPDWKNIVSFSSFSGNLYLLDRGASNIWRYMNIDGVYGEKKSWFVETPPNLSEAVALTINGAIWVLKKDGIVKFNLGKEESFSLSKMPASPNRGEPESFENPVKIYTSADSQNLYVLDKGRGKIYVFKKSGEFEIAYSGEQLKEASDLIAIESAKKIFLLSGNKIYEIGMK